jgi:hypothetical protein
MGLKGYRLWVNLIQRAEPHRTRTGTGTGAGDATSGGNSVALVHRHEPPPRLHPGHLQREPPRGVAPQVAFERQTLKPGFSLDRL